jgi:dTDP-4-dehydrorhamnose reductase
VISCDRSQVDLTQSKAIEQFIEQANADMIVNAAAYTAVDKAEEEPELAYAVNARAPEVMAQTAQKLSIPLIHYSTDYVFNGKNTQPWQESDETDPLGVYGASKLQGEQLVEQSGCQYLIFRTSWVYGTRGHNFLLTMSRLAVREQLSVVDDQVGSPTWSRHIADATALVIAQSLKQNDFWQQYSGIYHLSGASQTSWYGFAKAIFAEMAARGETVPELSAISTEQYPTPAQRPAYSCMDNTKLKQNFSVQLPDWQQSLQLVMDELL